MQIDHGNTWVVFIIDKQITTVVLTIGFRDGWMMGITKLDVLAIHPALCQYSLGLFIKAITLPWLRSKNSDVLEDTHGGDAIDNHLSTLPAGTECNVLVTSTGWCIRFCSCQNILFRQATILHDLFQLTGRPGTC